MHPSVAWPRSSTRPVRPERSVSMAPRGLAVAALALAAAALLAPATPVLAECDGPLPPFLQTVATARRVVVGDVVAVRGGGLSDPSISEGLSSRFTMRVVAVLRGAPASKLDISDLPTQPCAGVVGARVGDRLAIAFDGMAFTPPLRVNGVAWLRGVPILGAVSTTMPAIRAALARSVPDTSAQAAPPPGGDGAAALWLSFAAGVVVTLRRARREGSPPRRRAPGGGPSSPATHRCRPSRPERPIH